MDRPLITLTTDFGMRDAYTAAMKGVLTSLSPQSTILDLTHDIPPQDITEAAFFLRDALPWFPEDSIHIVVVDPRVGTGRNALGLDLAGRMVVCPDNGLASLVCELLPIRKASILDPSKITDQALSATFHGRDLFAPAAALLANGQPMELLGSPAETVVKLDWPIPEQPEEGTIRGEVVHLDRFGNAITNIPGNWIPSGRRAMALLADNRTCQLVTTYADAPPGELVVLVGSSGWIEVAVNGGSVASACGLLRGSTISIIIDTMTA